jgi:cytidylate kinase
MQRKSSSERLADAMAQTRRQWEMKRRAEEQVDAGQAARPAQPGFTIAISREAGANGSLIARALGQHLGWPVYDHELLHQVAQEMGLQADLLAQVDEKRKSWVQESLESLGATSTVSERGYVKHLLTTLLTLAAHGECIIVGRGAAQVLPAATTLRVRLVGPLANRIETIRQRYGVSQQEAAQRVKEADAERTRFVKDHFQKDPTDAGLYDVVLNSSRFTFPECTAIIMDVLHRLEAHQASPAR